MRGRPPFAAVYFDCDSTLSTIEGVDELTRGLGDAERTELRRLTKAAMDGELPLAQVYEERLHVIAPTRADLAGIAAFYIEHALPHAQETVAALRFLGKHVGVVSGGLHQPVLAFAEWLGIDPANVHAVPVHFDAAGHYVDFDRDSHLWKNQGKVSVLESIPETHRPVAFVGDGVTDLEAAPVVDLFVGFGGVDRRERVAAEADVYIETPDLAATIVPCLTDEEQAALRSEPRFANLLP